MSRAHGQPKERALAAWTRLTRHDPMEWRSAWNRSVFVGAFGLRGDRAYYGYQWQQVVFVVRYTAEHQHRQRKPGLHMGWIIEDVWALAHWRRAVARYDTEGRESR